MKYPLCIKQEIFSNLEAIYSDVNVLADVKYILHRYLAPLLKLFTALIVSIYFIFPLY